MPRLRSFFAAALLLVAFFPTALGAAPLPSPPAAPPEPPTGNVLVGALDAAYDQGVTCRESQGFQNVQCNQTTGHYGYGQIRWCNAPRKVGVGATIHDNVRELDETVAVVGPWSSLPAPASSGGVCTGAWEYAYAAAYAYGPTLG